MTFCHFVLVELGGDNVARLVLLGVDVYTGLILAKRTNPRSGADRVTVSSFP